MGERNELKNRYMVVNLPSEMADEHTPISTRQASDKYPTSIVRLIELIGEHTCSLKEMMGMMELKDRENFLGNYLNPSMEAGLVEPVYRELAEQFRAVNKAVSSWDAPALASLAPGLASLAEKTGTLTETFARLPEHYRDNLASVADLIFIGRSLERVAEGLQKVAAEALYGVGPRQS